MWTLFMLSHFDVSPKSKKHQNKGESTMFDRKSDYALNKTDPDAIVFKNSGRGLHTSAPRRLFVRGRISQVESMIRWGLPCQRSWQSCIRKAYRKSRPDIWAARLSVSRGSCFWEIRLAWQRRVYPSAFRGYQHLSVWNSAPESLEVLL